MLGEQPGDEQQQAPDPASFQAKARWQRAIVILAGPLMNILLAVLLLTGLYMYKFPKVDDNGPSVITEIETGSAAAQAGLKPGDRIVEFAGRANPKWEYISKQEMLNGNHTLDVDVLRDGKRLDLSVTPRIDPKEGIGTIGWGYANIEVEVVEPGSPAHVGGLKAGDIFLSIAGQPVASRSIVQDSILHSDGRTIDIGVKRGGVVTHLSVTPAKFGGSSVYRIGVQYGETYPFPVQIVKLSFPQAFAQSVRENRDISIAVFQTLGSILQRRVSPKSVSGPIGMAKTSGDAYKRGLWTYLSFMAFVSLNLAIFNLLPIPILDGGTLVLLLIEMLLQREVSMHIKEAVLKLGFVLLMMVVVFVIYNDLTKS
jgi:regulator of sigma E protease